MLKLLLVSVLGVAPSPLDEVDALLGRNARLDERVAVPPLAALAELEVAGPPRFHQLAPGVYRGGQPTERDLLLLRSLGVHTVVNLRRGSSVAIERAAAERLGMRFVHVPWAGASTPPEAELRQIIDVMREGGVYVHCKHGRDRTSLVAATYRVWVDGWPAERAWREEAERYGFRAGWFLGGLEVSFRLATR
jgi:protein tyrosine/serine phosphatase